MATILTLVSAMSRHHGSSMIGLSILPILRVLLTNYKHGVTWEEANNLGKTQDYSWIVFVFIGVD